MMYGGYEFFILGALFKLMFVAGAIVLIVALLRGRGPRWHESPLDILKRRLAKGEISREDYDALKTELS